MVGDNTIIVLLHPALARRTQLGKGRLTFEYEPGMTASSVSERVLRPEDTQAVLLFVNHLPAPPNRVLQAGDTLELVLAIAGGSLC
jgi:hypothetical protein